MTNTDVRHFDWVGANQWWEEHKELIRSRQNINRMKRSIQLYLKEDKTHAV